MEETKTLQEEYSPTEAKREKVRRVAVAMIDDFPEHPFMIHDGLYNKADFYLQYFFGVYFLFFSFASQ